MKRLTVITLILLFLQTNIFAQTLAENEHKLKLIFNELHNVKGNLKKDSVNDILKKVLKQTLYMNKSFKYPFDSLKYLGKIKSEDKKLRIYTWNYIKENAQLAYFGFIQYYHRKTKKYLIYELKDKTDKIKKPVIAVLSPGMWYGALYYKIITKTYKRKTHYAILGWNANDDFTNKKIIETLHFNRNGIPTFGERILGFENRRYCRLIFEYAEQAGMMLRYDKDKKMIIWDHLSPPVPSLTGQYKYYGPDFSYDGLFFNKGKWDYYPDLNVKNNR